MSIDISRVARALSDLSVGSNSPLKLSHAQQCVSAAIGFKSLAAYQTAKKLETPVDNNCSFVIIENDLLASRALKFGMLERGVADRGPNIVRLVGGSSSSISRNR